jgi:hypothetical protein
MSIDDTDRTSKPSKRWWFKIRFKLARWLRAEVEAGRQTFDGSATLVEDQGTKALPPPH